MKASEESKISDVTTFKSNLKSTIGTPFENSGLVLMLCVEGCAILSINFKEHTFRKGDIAIIPTGMTLIPHQVSSLFETEIIGVEERHCEETEYKIADVSFWNFMLQHPILRPTAEQYEMLHDWFKQMRWMTRESTCPFFHEIISNSLLTLFMSIYREVKAFVQAADKGQTSSRTLKLFTDFTNLVARHHKRCREVAFYANLLSITPDYLNKVCKMHWDTSAKEYIDWQVVMAIKNYLTCTDLSIKGIAAQLHFDDPSYMCRFFKRQTGSSPAQFRKGDD